MLKTLLNFLITLLSPSPKPSLPNQSPPNEPSVPASPQNPPQSQPAKPDVKMEIDWTKLNSKVSKYFTVRETTYLPSWNVCHTPSEEEKANIIKLALIMDKVRDLIGVPIGIHVWIRPKVLNCPGSDHHGQDYNALIGGAKRSAHILGSGVDWSCKGFTCDKVREMLVPKLEEFGLRCEDKPGSNWVHLDTYPPSVSGGKRFFPV